MRYDGSSKFKPENRWDFFYGISGGWRITEEAFMKNIKWLNDLKSVFLMVKLVTKVVLIVTMVRSSINLNLKAELISVLTKALS